MKKKKRLTEKLLIALVLLAWVALGSLLPDDSTEVFENEPSYSVAEEDTSSTVEDQEEAKEDQPKKEIVKEKKTESKNQENSSDRFTENTYSQAYVDKGSSRFSREEIKRAKKSFKKFSEFDSLGRCGPAIASIGPDMLPKEERTSIGSVKPTGWHTVRYDDLISDRYLYNRCHLIAFCLSGENANKLNLITGTRYLNVEGMLPFEMEVLDYVKRTGNHVLYRVTPDFKRDELVARGVVIEAKSIENNRIDFRVYCPNVQPGISIDYKTGESKRIA